MNEGATFNDVTPLRLTTGAGDATFAATNGSSTITVTETAHGAAVNDFVTFSDAVSLGGNITAAVLNQEYQIVSVTSTDVFTIEAVDTSGSSVTANSSVTRGTAVAPLLPSIKSTLDSTHLSWVLVGVLGHGVQVHFW